MSETIERLATTEGGRAVDAAPGSISLRTYALAALAERVGAGTAADTPEARYLIDHLDAVDPGRTGWARSLPDYLKGLAPGDRPLAALSHALGLTIFEGLTVALCAAVEDDAMVGRTVAYVQAPLGGSRPSVGLVVEAFAGTASGMRLPDALMCGAAMESGLLTLLGDQAPLPERPLAVPLHLSLALHGYDGFWAGTAIGTGGIPDTILPQSIREEAQRQAAGLMADGQDVLVVRTGSRTEARAVASLIAADLQRRPLFIETEKIAGLGPWLMLRGLLPVFCLDLAPGERRTLPVVPCYRGPVLAMCGPDGSVEASGRPVPGWTLPVPPVAEREALWNAAIGDGEMAADLARSHRHGSGRIFHLGQLSRREAALRGRDRPDRDDLAAASWITEGAGLDGLAEPLRRVVGDETLVAAPALRQQLDLLLQRCRVRDRLADGLGASVRAAHHPGVRALFVGPSGTGKTLAAGWLATRLGLPLYRVDLASVTSKYIGETEKNLSQLLARAEQTEVILLFDEADSLFGKRTDVKDANDRFANAQTNYLLQRIETFDGISILTSNSRARFDAAFARRLDAIIQFSAPGPEERRSLWLSHLGAHHALGQQELNQLSAIADLCGGEIRNAVLTAAVVANAAARPIAYADIICGLAGEYRKLSRQMPLDLNAIG
jgi:hypothetical protein